MARPSPTLGVRNRPSAPARRAAPTRRAAPAGSAAPKPASPGLLEEAAAAGLAKYWPPDPGPPRVLFKADRVELSGEATSELAGRKAPTGPARGVAAGAGAVVRSLQREAAEQAMREGARPVFGEPASPGPTDGPSKADDKNKPPQPEDKAKPAEGTPASEPKNSAGGEKKAPEDEFETRVGRMAPKELEARQEALQKRIGELFFDLPEADRVSMGKRMRQLVEQVAKEQGVSAEKVMELKGDLIKAEGMRLWSQDRIETTDGAQGITNPEQSREYAREHPDYRRDLEMRDAGREYLLVTDRRRAAR